MSLPKDGGVKPPKKPAAAAPSVKVAQINTRPPTGKPTRGTRTS